MAEKKMTQLDWVALILVLVGGLNWGLVGAIETDLIELLLGSLTPIVQKALHILIGLSALYMAYNAVQKK